MTKKDYILIAKMLKEYRPSNPDATDWGVCFHQWRVLTEAIAVIFAENNPMFDYDRFYIACGGLQWDATFKI